EANGLAIADRKPKLDPEVIRALVTGRADGCRTLAKELSGAVDGRAGGTWGASGRPGDLQPAVHRQRVPGDPAGVAGAEESDRSRDVGRLADASQRILSSQMIRAALRIPRTGPDGAWCHGVHADPALATAAGEIRDDRGQSGFRCGVGLAPDRHQGVDRADQD